MYENLREGLNVDFQKKYAELLKKVDKEVQGRLKKKRAVVSVSEPPRPLVEPLYAIHQRSLPPSIDKPVAWGFSKTEAKAWIGTRFKIRQVLERGQEHKTVIYYDIVCQDGKIHDIYENTGDITKEIEEMTDTAVISDDIVNPNPEVNIGWIDN